MARPPGKKDSQHDIWDVCAALDRRRFPGGLALVDSSVLLGFGACPLINLTIQDLTFAREMLGRELTQGELGLLFLRRQFFAHAEEARKRRENQRRAARRPRPSRRHPSRDRACELARLIRKRKPKISERNVVIHVRNELEEEELDPPSETSVKRWLREAGKS